ncbi:3-isopropylmalate dehydratase small subunit [Nanoarchaeota archaeon]
MKGKAHVYKRAHINTDEIIPARYLNSDEESELAKYAMEDIDKEFVKNVKPGDFIVAGEDFGCGSSREHAVWALRGAGIKAVIGKSFARIFFRNCINNGLLVIESQDAADKINTGDELEIDVKSGIIKNITKNQEIEFVAIPEFALKMIEEGGLLNHIGKEVKK